MDSGVKITWYVKEFCGIVAYLIKNPQYKPMKGYVTIPKNDLVRFLDKNAYEHHLTKLKVWKALNWIDTDEDRYTKKITDSETGKRTRVIKINFTVYETLVPLLEKYENNVGLFDKMK